MNHQHLEVYQLLIECFDTQNMEPIYPWLADSIKKTSMWDRDNFEGKDKMIEYFKQKVSTFINNVHYFFGLTILKSTDVDSLTEHNFEIIDFNNFRGNTNVS